MDELTTNGYSTSTMENVTSGEEEEELIVFDLPVWRQITWSLLFCIIAIIGTTGNSIVIWIVVGHKQMRTVTNLFIVNLAVADGLVALLNVTFTSYTLIYRTWPFGRAYCKLSEFIAAMSITVSVLTLSAIAIDRYIAIINPFQNRLGKKKTILATIAIWIASAVLSCPTWIFVTTLEATVENSRGSENRIICHSQWPDTLFGDIQEFIYSILFMVITYFLPLACMCFTYTRIGEKLWGAASIGEQTPIQLENIQAKRKIVKMMIVVVVIFGVCWLPFQLYFLVMLTASPEHEWPSYVNEMFIASFWLAMSNSMYNPMIYCWMNAKFRDGFKKALRWCPCIKYTEENSLNDTLLNITRSSTVD